MSASNATSSDLQLLSEEEVAISPDSAVVAQRSALQPQQVDESNDDAMGIDSLPDEMIVEVFSHLTQNQLGQIARVCKKWNALTKSPVLWKKVNLKIFFSSDRERNAQSFTSYIDGLPSCVTFIQLHFPVDYFPGRAPFDNHLDFEKLCMKLHPKCPKLEVLILEYCRISTNVPKAINTCTQFLQGLKKLVFSSCLFEDYSGTAELEANSKIEVLDLYCSGFYSSGQIQFSKLHSLKELRLAGTYVDGTWFVGDASFWNQLQVLDLRNTRVTASTFRAIQRHGQNLRDLYLCRSDLDDGDFSFSGPVFPQLQTICLSGTDVTGETLISLVRSRPSLVSVYVDKYEAEDFAEHPFVVANRCMSGIVKSIDDVHDHNVDYLRN